MTVILIVLLVVLALVGVSLALSRTTREAHSVRDDEFVELDGSWIRYRVVGQGPPVLLVHGFLSSSRIWAPLAERLAGRFTVYSLDLRGFGESDKPLTGYGVRHGTRLLYSFCTHFRLGKVGVVGHDIGGDMAVKLAADHPELVGSVTLVASPANEEQMDLPTSLWLATLPVIGPLFYALGQYAGFVRRLWLRPFVSEKRSLPDELVEDAALSTPAAVRSTFNTARREISRERVARQMPYVRVPVLVVVGEEDQIVDPRSSEVWSSRAPRSEVALLEACGHLPMHEFPEEFGARLLSFLGGEGREGGYVPESRPRRATGSAAFGEPRPVEDETRGIDGLEPDEEASAAEPYASGGGRRRGAFSGDYSESEGREDETGELGYAPGVKPESDEGSAAEPADETTRHTGDKSGRSRGVRGEYIIPEIPDELFQWSDMEESRRRRSGDDRGNGGTYRKHYREDPDETNESS